MGTSLNRISLADSELGEGMERLFAEVVRAVSSVTSSFGHSSMDSGDA